MKVSSLCEEAMHEKRVEAPTLHRCAALRLSKRNLVHGTVVSNFSATAKRRQNIINDPERILEQHRHSQAPNTLLSSLSNETGRYDVDPNFINGLLTAAALGRRADRRSSRLVRRCERRVFVHSACAAARRGESEGSTATTPKQPAPNPPPGTRRRPACRSSCWAPRRAQCRPSRAAAPRRAAAARQLGRSRRPT